MLVTEQERLRDRIRELAKLNGNNRAALIPILQEVQKTHTHISEYAMQEIADQLGIHPVEVYSVVSFYAFLKDKPQGRFIIRLCQTVSCDMAGKDRVARQLMNDLGIDFGQTTADGKFSLEYASCLGMCDQGPAMLINDKVFTHVTPEQVHEILEECRASYGLHALESKEENIL